MTDEERKGSGRRRDGKGAGGRANGSGGGRAEPPPGGGDVLAFPGERARGRRPRGRDDGPGTPGAETPPGEAPEPTLAERVCAYAARGLNEAEIRVRLGLPEAPVEAPEWAGPGPQDTEAPEDSEAALAAAFQRGQLLGRAAIKEAQFEAALNGRVTAQAQVLARLGEPRGEAVGEAGAGDVDVEAFVLDPEDAGPTPD